MTPGTIAILLVAVALFAALAWLLRRPVQTRRETTAVPVEIENLRLRHARYFSHLRQALSKQDEAFLQERLPAAKLRRWRGERRQAALKFLTGLDEDFRRLSQMARIVTKHSAEVERGQQFELLRLSIRFRMLFWGILLQLRLGRLPQLQVRRITDLVGTFSAEIEAAMLAASQPPAQRGDLTV